MIESRQNFLPQTIVDVKGKPSRDNKFQEILARQDCVTYLFRASLFEQLPGPPGVPKLCPSKLPKRLKLSDLSQKDASNSVRSFSNIARVQNVSFGAH